MRKKIMISAGGTATSWHIVKTIKSKFNEHFEVFVTDINPEHLIPSAKICDSFFQVPKISDSGYYEYMMDLFQKQKVDIFVPLIDFDLKKFSNDNDHLLKFGIVSSAPNQSTIDKFLDKAITSEFLMENGLFVPKVYEQHKLVTENQYFIKPREGFGSRGIQVAYGRDLRNRDLSDFLIQDICQTPEITVEVFCSDGELRTICRERIEVKAGVCTKARIFFNDDLHEIVTKLSKIINLPVASCIQFMRYQDHWAITDLNLRLGAGTALSTCAGWDLTGAALNSWANLQQSSLSFLNYFKQDKYVVRYYQEMLM